MKKMYEEIEYGKDFICISDDKGEIVYWDIQEWKDDENIVFSICKAIELSKEDKLRDFLKNNIQ